MKQEDGSEGLVLRDNVPHFVNREQEISHNQIRG